MALLNCVTHVASLCSLVISITFISIYEYIITYFLYTKLAHLYIDKLTSHLWLNYGVQCVTGCVRSS